MALDLVHIIEQLGIDATKFDEWREAVLGQREEQAIPLDFADGSQESGNQNIPKSINANSKQT
ncbi:hypothetical protein GZH47_08245 [Paenibacillus rhizovicinus]|uniref:Uncharacterized protein n=1 Tax=Paenibacillus rhizovicinus TaxID=2704463 RepID=A0A6C0NX81_9BACL|nr:hypothetical protein [Paenibacillus rhizovicinus]QHW30844.1 hypothetical protein GZH47_08245 [Paenibacillus rhizovicinus]